MIFPPTNLGTTGPGYNFPGVVFGEQFEVVASHCKASLLATVRLEKE